MKERVNSYKKEILDENKEASNEGMLERHDKSMKKETKKRRKPEVIFKSFQMKFIGFAFNFLILLLFSIVSSLN